MLKPALLNKALCCLIVNLLCSSHAVAGGARDCINDPACFVAYDEGHHFIAVGNKQESQGDHAAAQLSYKKALEKLSLAYTKCADPRLLLDMGKVLVKLGEYSDGIKTLKDAQRLGEDDPEIQLSSKEWLEKARTQQAQSSLPGSFRPAVKPAGEPLCSTVVCKVVVGVLSGGTSVVLTGVAINHMSIRLKGQPDGVMLSALTRF